MEKLKDSKNRNTLYIGLVALLFVALVIGIVISNHKRSQQLQNSQTTTVTSAEVQKLTRNIEDDPQAVGKTHAPVTMIEYSDLRCPYCAQLYTTSETKILSEFVDTGKLRIEMRNYPILGDESVLAAHAAVAAGKQGKYFQFVNKIYQNAPSQGHLELDDKTLINFASAVGVPNIEKFTSDMKSKSVADEVQKDIDEGQKLGVQGTPTVFINGVKVDSPSYDSIAQAINQQLEHK
ncbi:MAG: thioredoxin domain-containing protein [Micrococcaceae bacterium]